MGSPRAPFAGYRRARFGQTGEISAARMDVYRPPGSGDFRCFQEPPSHRLQKAGDNGDDADGGKEIEHETAHALGFAPEGDVSRSARMLPAYWIDVSELTT